ncbi:MAG: hypothetical protein JWN02_2143 [Acidobacteria bacterium]|nr:hypothetical protein [Acidobacteriota bacterium]
MKKRTQHLSDVYSWPMTATISRALLAATLLVSAAAATKPIHHYIFFNRDRARIGDAAFLGNPRIEGAQVKYTWRELEPRKGTYDFSAIRHDLGFLTAHKKRLFVQLQDVSFDPAVVNVPQYLLDEPGYHGGADRQYAYQTKESDAVAEGWVARRWDPAVRERFALLLAALGKEFDGRIEGIVLPETAVDFGESGRLFPKGFTPEGYRDAVIANMLALRRAFPRSVAMQYANFMPGEWLPWTDKKLLASVYRAARKHGVAVGGPDLLPYRKGQMSHSYPLIAACNGILKTGIAVQEGNYQQRDPRTGKQVTTAQLLAFARHYLNVDYLFWCTEEPFYSRDVLTLLEHTPRR